MKAFSLISEVMICERYFPINPVTEILSSVNLNRAYKISAF